MRARLAGALGALLIVSGTAGVVAPPASAAPQPNIVINEVESSGGVPGDWVELKNTGTDPIDVSGWVFKDNDDSNNYAIPAGSTIAAGGFLVLDESTFGFGLGKADSARLFTGTGSLVDGYSWTSHAAVTYGRCADGTGAFTSLDAASKGAANACPTPEPDPTPEPSPDPTPTPTPDPTDPTPPATPVGLVINEVESDGAAGVLSGADWIELKNITASPIDASGVVVVDDKDEKQFTIPAGTTVAAGGYLVLVNGTDFAFGLGKGDSVRLFAPGTVNTATASPFASYTWPNNHAAVTYGRCPDGTGEFTDTAAATPGTANSCGTTPPVDPPVDPVAEPDELSTTLAINEVESNGDDTDWVEVMNLTGSPIDISGWAIKDNDDTRTDVVPAGSVVPAHGLLVIDQQTATYPAGFTFGLGNTDMFRLYDGKGTLVAKTSWATHSVTSYGRCPDGTGDMTTTTATTKGGANDCSIPLRINEVESSGGTPGDWIELVNAGTTALAVGGFVVKDNDNAHSYVIPAGTTVAPGAYLVIEEAQLGFGLGGADAVRVFAADGTTLVASYTWTAHAGTTYGRCPDTTGDFADTTKPTKGLANLCAGIVTASAWPGGTAVSTVDAEPLIGGDLSGVDFDPTSGDVWAVENGNGVLYSFIAGTNGTWSPAPGWEAGKALRYPDGSGKVDAEGVTVTSAGRAGGIYVSSERNNAASSVSRPSVLRYDANATGDTLTATAEWNLAADFPGLGANQGLEGITWISDAFLTARGFIDERTGAAYAPSTYPGHGSGLFVVGVEGTASAYVYALMSNGTFSRVATISTESVSFALVADVQFDAERGTLFVVCDEACGGRIAAYTLKDGRFTASALYERPSGMANIANEGFAIASAGWCTSAGVPTFYADDADTDGFSLRTGTFPCTGGVAVTTPPSANPGSQVPLAVGTEYAGTMIDAWLHSTPTYLGRYAVGANGIVTVTLPELTPLGDHTVVLLESDGTLLGTGSLSVAAAAGPGTPTETPGQGKLAFTGNGDVATLAGLALLMIALGAGILRRSRRA